MSFLVINFSMIRVKLNPNLCCEESNAYNLGFGGFEAQTHSQFVTNEHFGKTPF